MRSATHELPPPRAGGGIHPKRETESEMRLAADGGQVAHDDAAHVLASPMAWRRSSRCATQSCVEVADLPDGVAIRDSKSPGTSPILVFTADEWESFISGVKAGEFG